LKPSAYTASASEPVLNFRQKPEDRSNMAKYLFGGFKKCLYPVQKFQSDTERKLAVILEREALKWFKPANGQFQIVYKFGADNPEYQPDFVAETDSVIYMLESKAKNELADVDVIAKKDAAVKWCQHASNHAKTYKGKQWEYLLIPHDLVADNMTLKGLSDASRILDA
jgi:type III restriction enzyme